MHDIKTDAGQKTAMGIGFFISTVMLAASGYFNAAFGFRLGQTYVDGVVFAIIGVAFEVFLALMPFYFMSALRARALGTGLFLLFVWLFLIGVSANAAIGHIAGSRLSAMSNKMGAATSFQDTRKDLERARKDLEWKAKPKESVDNLSAQVKGQEGNILYAQTSQCANQWTAPAKAFCSKLTELRAKLGDAIEYKALEDKVAALTAKSDAAVANHVTVIAEGADAQANLYAKALGVDVTTVSGAISGVFAAAILMIASMGFYISVTPMRAAQRQAAKTAAKVSDKTIIDAEFTPVAEPQGLLLTTESGKPIDFQIKQAAQAVAPGKDLTQDARELLLAIGMPTRPCDVREKDDRSVLAWRFAAWLAAHGHVGDYTAEQVDALYDRYTREDCRQPWATRVVKAELQQLKPQCAYTSNPRQDDGSRVTMWTIKPPSVLRLTDILRRKGIANALPPPSPQPAPEPAQPPAQEPAKNVLSFFKRAAGD